MSSRFDLSRPSCARWLTLNATSCCTAMQELMKQHGLPWREGEVMDKSDAIQRILESSDSSRCEVDAHRLQLTGSYSHA